MKPAGYLNYLNHEFHNTNVNFTQMKLICNVCGIKCNYYPRWDSYWYFDKVERINITCEEQQIKNIIE